MTKKMFASSISLVASALLAACGQTDDGADQSPTTVSEATALNPTSDAAEGSDGTTAGNTATGASETSETARESEAADDPANFGDLEVADAAMYTAQGSGSRAGTSFTTEDGTVACHITGVAAACVVVDNQSAWNESDRANDGLAGTGAPLNTVGWNPSLGADFGQGPKAWTQQGEFPIRDGATLENGAMMSVFVNSQTTVECGVRDNTVTCTDGHGDFTVSKDGLAIRP